MYYINSDTAYVDIMSLPDGYYMENNVTRVDLSEYNPDVKIVVKAVETTSTSTTTTTTTTSTTTVTYKYQVQFVDENYNGLEGVQFRFVSGNPNDDAFPVQTSNGGVYNYFINSDTAYIDIISVPNGHYMGIDRVYLSGNDSDIIPVIFPVFTTTLTATSTSTTTTTTMPYPVKVEPNIIALPKTEYSIGDELDLSDGYYNIKTIDNNNMESYSDRYSMVNNPNVDTSEFDSTKPGTYRIYINYSNNGTSSQTYFEVTITDKTESFKLGDVNEDGRVDSVDASAVLAEYANLSTGGTGTFDEKQKKSADINGDGKTDSVDASGILAYYAFASTVGGKSFEEWLSENNV
ncbi:MAG: bacterial Ig-like domain-containing protein [Ruminococcus sp.]|nr:bacterial Ig-like domain-containing protein [Ruminococcus sp.]